jgi:hypothetical protein
MSDSEIANIGRYLAIALSRRGYERSPEATKEVLRLQTELCAAVRSEEPPKEPEVPS